MSEIHDWPITDNAQTDPSKSGMPEGMPRSSVNDRGREHLGAIRRWYDAPEWLDLMRDADGDALTVTKLSAHVLRITSGATDMSAYFNAGRRVKITGGAVDPVYAHVASAAYVDPNTDVTLEGYSTGTEIPAGADGVELHHSSTLSKLAFSEVAQTTFYLPVTADSEGIQAAIDEASADGGGIVLLSAPSYACDAQITLKSTVTMMGISAEATALVFDAAVVMHALKLESNTKLASLELDCSAQSGSYDAISVAVGVDHVSIEGVKITEAARDAIQTLGTNSYISIRDVEVVNPTRYGIYVLDSNNNDYAIQLDGIRIDMTTAGEFGLLMAGVCNASNVFVELGSGSTVQRGIYMATKNASGLNNSRQSSLTGFTVIGDGISAIGVELRGSECAVSAGGIYLTHASSRGILFNSTGAGQWADHNVVSNVSIKVGSIGVYFLPDASDNILRGCSVIDCGQDGIFDSGRRNLIANNIIDNATRYGIFCNLASQESRLQGNVIRNCASHGIYIQSGAQGVWLDGNDVTDGNTTAFESDAAGGEVKAGKNHGVPIYDEVYWVLDGDDSLDSYLESGYAQFADFVVDLPNGGGEQAYEIDFSIRLVGGNQYQKLLLKVGPDGAWTDSTIWSTVETYWGPVNETLTGTFRYYGSAGDKVITLWLEYGGGGTGGNVPVVLHGATDLSADDWVSVSNAWTFSTDTPDSSTPDRDTYVRARVVHYA